MESRTTAGKSPVRENGVASLDEVPEYGRARETRSEPAGTTP